MKKILNWLFILVPFILLAIILVKITGFHLNGSRPYSFDQGVHLSQHFGHGSGHFGAHNGARFYEQINVHAFIFPITFVFILLKIGLAFTGISIWKFSKGKIGKTLGAILFTLAVFSMLPKILGIPFLFIMAYLGYKAYQKTEDQHFNSNSSAVIAPASHYQIGDFLDEWEQTVRKEEH